jgi:hypothetical protein
MLDRLDGVSRLQLGDPEPQRRIRPWVQCVGLAKRNAGPFVVLSQEALGPLMKERLLVLR